MVEEVQPQEAQEIRALQEQIAEKCEGEKGADEQVERFGALKASINNDLDEV